MEREWKSLDPNEGVIFSDVSYREQVTFRWDDDDVSFVLDQQAWVRICSARSLKQQSVCRDLNQSRHIILIDPCVEIWTNQDILF